ncbi:Conserved Oligomeric Golgi Complex Subunit 7 [Manis pentadactyla]|nr:Conserved Oligomeric Golgi Complex Subunit 7 [Manis pentadactyla]
MQFKPVHQLFPKERNRGEEHIPRARRSRILLQSGGTETGGWLCGRMKVDDLQLTQSPRTVLGQLQLKTGAEWMHTQSSCSSTAIPRASPSQHLSGIFIQLANIKYVVGTILGTGDTVSIKNILYVVPHSLESPVVHVEGNLGTVFGEDTPSSALDSWSWLLSTARSSPRRSDFDLQLHCGT